MNAASDAACATQAFSVKTPFSASVMPVDLASSGTSSRGRTTNRVPWVLHLHMGRQACLQVIIKYILENVTRACLAVQLVHTLGTWPLAGTSTTWYRQEKPLAVWTILIPATWGRLWHQLLEALDNFELLGTRASQLQVWSHVYGTTVSGSSQVVIQVLHDLARSSSRVECT